MFLCTNVKNFIVFQNHFNGLWILHEPVGSILSGVFWKKKFSLSSFCQSEFVHSIFSSRHRSSVMKTLSVDHEKCCWHFWHRKIIAFIQYFKFPPNQSMFRESIELMIEYCFQLLFFLRLKMKPFLLILRNCERRRMRRYIWWKLLRQTNPAAYNVVFGFRYQ